MDNFVQQDRERNENRTIETGSTNRVHLRKSGPYGFWAVSFDRGKPPEYLTGLYTSPTDAERAVHTYLKSKGRLPE